MPEPPDFEKIARQSLARMVDTHTEPRHHPPGHDCPGCTTLSAVTEQLRQVWNARGAADLAAVKAQLLGACVDGQHSDPDNSGQCISCGVVLDYLEPGERAEDLERALRSLDR